MSLSMYNSTSPVFQRYLNNLLAIINKAEIHANNKNIEPNVLLQARLFPDMLPFIRQVQIACDFAKGTIARLTNQEAPKHEDNEQTFSELKTRIQKTLDYVASINPEHINGSEAHNINYEIKRANINLNFTGEQYLMHFALPNFYFHCVTAYDILRHHGVELGKQDYLGSFELN